MALKIRLARAGAKKRPFYRIVIAEANAPRDGRFIEKVGTYNPMLPKDAGNRVVLDVERIKHWLSVGALPTDRVERFLSQAQLIATPEVKKNLIKGVPKKKAQERLAAEKAAAEALKEAKEAPAPEAPVAEEVAPAEEEPAAAEGSEASEPAPTVDEEAPKESSAPESTEPEA